MLCHFHAWGLRRWLGLSLYLLAPPCWAAGPDAQELVFFSWSDYIDPAIVEEFERAHDAKLTQVFFETDDIRTDMLLETDGRGYDVVVVNGAEMEAYVQHGWLAPIDAAAVSNLRHIDSRWTTAFAGAAGNGVPYFWGTIGIGYRSDLVPGPVTSWMDLYRPHESLHGKIVMIKSARDVLGMALKALGFSVNSIDAAELSQAEQLLTAQRPAVKTYSYVSLTEDSSLVTGEIAMAMMYNGDAITLQEYDERIRYVVPREGTELWVDYLTVMSSSDKKALAARFIDFLHHPEIAARNAEYLHYATPNRAAEAHLPPQYLNDPVIYPPREVMDRSESYAKLPPRALKRRNEFFNGLAR